MAGLPKMARRLAGQHWLNARWLLNVIVLTYAVITNVSSAIAAVVKRLLLLPGSFWVALAYTHGQRLMVPNHQWSFNEKLGTHRCDAPVEVFAPMYRFIRAQAKYFDAFEAVQPNYLEFGKNVHCTIRLNRVSRQVVLHVLNRLEPRRIRIRNMSL